MHIVIPAVILIFVAYVSILIHEKRTEKDTVLALQYKDETYYQHFRNAEVSLVGEFIKIEFDHSKKERSSIFFKQEDIKYMFYICEYDPANDKIYHFR